jgi:hypothetical protein
MQAFVLFFIFTLIEHIRDIVYYLHWSIIIAFISHWIICVLIGNWLRHSLLYWSYLDLYNIWNWVNFSISSRKWEKGLLDFESLSDLLLWNEQFTVLKLKCYKLKENLCCFGLFQFVSVCFGLFETPNRTPHYEGPTTPSSSAASPTSSCRRATGRKTSLPPAWSNAHAAPPLQQQHHYHWAAPSGNRPSLPCTKARPLQTHTLKGH